MIVDSYKLHELHVTWRDMMVPRSSKQIWFSYRKSKEGLGKVQQFFGMLVWMNCLPMCSAIIRVINKGFRVRVIFDFLIFRFVYHEYDYRQNWTTHSPVTLSNYEHDAYTAPLVLKSAGDNQSRWRILLKFWLTVKSPSFGAFSGSVGYSQSLIWLGWTIFQTHWSWVSRGSTATGQTYGKLKSIC